MDNPIRSRVDARLTRLFREGEFDPSVARHKRYPVFPPYGLGIINRELRKRDYATSLADLNHAIFANGCEYSAWKEALRARFERFVILDLHRLM